MNTDFVVIGAGILGLAVARGLKHRYPDHRVVVLEKESATGQHASSRNSGVLHSGIYYPPESLKAQICARGAQELAAYCEERGLPVNRLGKLLVPAKVADAAQLALLESRGVSNGVCSQRVDAAALRTLEPEVRSATGDALLVPGTAVVSPRRVMEWLTREVQAAGVDIRCGGMLEAVDPQKRTITWSGTTLSFGHAVNCAGAHADAVAHMFGAGRRYTVLPFRGAYWKLDPASGIRVRHLVYPVPDLRVPFLGVHTTTSTAGDIYLGPTATPALGRENYRGLHGSTFAEATRIGGRLLQLVLAGHDGFRRLAWQEAKRVTRSGFAVAARALLPRLEARHLLASDKVGVRAQMLDLATGRLVMDFLVESSAGSTHVLNAISPAFTCAFPLARLLVDDHIDQPSNRDIVSHGT
jgi:(S)-2-hydroxyglutarate dehydrogenase